MAFKYEGDLSKPIPAPIIGLLMDDEQIHGIFESIAQEKHRRMIQLFDVYGIQHGNWEALCFALAAAHVPGLSVAKARAGRKTVWDAITRAELVLAVEETGIDNITEATALLAAQEPWLSLLRATRGAETLRDQYTRADSRWVEVCRKARLYGAMNEA